MTEGGAPPWPADNVERRPLESLVPYASNARTHSDAQIAQIAASMKEWGWTNPVLVDEVGTIIAGHGRVLAARLLGFDEAPVMVARGWTNAQKRAYCLADNKLAENASWDSEILSVELDELRDLGFDLDVIGFQRVELNELIGTPNDAPSAEDDSKGALLELANITIGEPRTAVERGERWQLGQHTLVVASVVEDWSMWAPLLDTGALFCPFPGPFVLASERAKTARLLLVQPDAYTAGHIVDRYIELFGEQQVSRVAA